MKRENRKQKRLRLFRASKAKSQGKATGFKVVSKPGAAVTLIEIELTPKRRQNLSVGKATFEMVK